MAWYIDLIIYIWSLFKLWLSAFFSAPFRKPDMLWVLIPVWLGWLFAEFFQEKHKTSIGNAISNSIVVLWGAIDCVRQTVSFIALGVLGGFWDLFFRFFLAALMQKGRHESKRHKSWGHFCAETSAH